MSLFINYRLEDWRIRVRFPMGAVIFLLPIASKLALQSTQHSSKDLDAGHIHGHNQRKMRIQCVTEWYTVLHNFEIFR